MKTKFHAENQKQFNSPWEVDYHTLIEFEGLFEEYLEMGAYSTAMLLMQLTPMTVRSFAVSDLYVNVPVKELDLILVLKINQSKEDAEKNSYVSHSSIKNVCVVTGSKKESNS